MRLDRHGIISGQPIKRVRDFLRRRLGDNRLVGRERIAEFFGTKPRATATLIQALLKRGLIEPSKYVDEDGVYYRLGEHGPRLRNALLLPPISRQRAEELLAAFLQRVVEVNADPDLITYVAGVRVFGSYLSDSAELGDIDLAVSYRKKLPGKEWVQASLRRAHESGRQFSNHGQMLDHGVREVVLRLKARQAYLHFVKDFEELETVSKVVFREEREPSPCRTRTRK